MSNNRELAEQLNKFFVEYGLEWKRRDQTMFVPSVEDFEDALAKIREGMYDLEDGHQMDVGRLIVKKDAGHLDVYVRVGELA